MNQKVSPVMAAGFLAVGMAAILWVGLQWYQELHPRWHVQQSSNEIVWTNEKGEMLSIVTGDGEAISVRLTPDIVRKASEVYLERRQASTADLK